MRGTFAYQIALLCGVLFLMTGSAALAIDLNVQITSGGMSSVTVSPGDAVAYQITGELSDDPSEGLAFVLFDLTFSDVATAMPQVSAGATMSAFEIPEGLTNPLPVGFGGTQQGNVLIQVGGAQNTISNTSTYAPYPIGGVVTGIGAYGSPVVIATGSLTAPSTEDTYTLDVGNVLAAVIADGEDGTGEFWAVESAEVGTVGGLSITVQGIPTDPCVINSDCVLANNNCCEWDFCGSVVPGYCDPVVPMMFGDITGTTNNSAPNGAVNLSDVLCTLDGFGLGNLENCANADVAVTQAADCPTGNGVVNLSDILKILDAFGAPSSPTALFMCDCPLNP